MSESAPLIGITGYSRLIAEVSKGIATGLGDETCDIFLRSYARNRSEEHTSELQSH